MSRSTDQQPATVPETATQAGPIDRWWWVEPTVWTQRMLTALEKGVKGGMWFSLMDKVYSPRNLKAAWARVRLNAGAAGIDKQTGLPFISAKLAENGPQAGHQPAHLLDRLANCLGGQVQVQKQPVP